MTWRSRLVSILLVAMCACSGRGNAGAYTTPHPDNQSARVEYFVSKPQGPGPWPTIVLLHGHQSFWSRPGGLQFVDWGVLDQFAGKGYLAVSISLPGYGNSDGPADFAGPYTQHAVAAVIAKLRDDGLAADSKIVIQGISLGAITAALVAAHDSSIAGLVLISGLYDVLDFIRHPKSIRAQLLKYSILDQVDGNADALKDRSALNFADTIRATTLIINGAKDDRTDPDQARLLAEKIRSHGGNARVRIYPEYGHEIPVSVRAAEIDAFIAGIFGPPSAE